MLDGTRLDLLGQIFCFSLCLGFFCCSIGAVHGFGVTRQSKGGNGLFFPCIVPIGAAESHEVPNNDRPVPEPQLLLH